MRNIILFFIAIAISTNLLAQVNKEKRTITAVFYNVENLFDTINDPSINDEEWLPESAKKWNTERYNKKLENLAKVICSINTNEIPEIIGFAEIENRSVLEDLINTESLKSKNYKIVHEDSPDARGIDVGLIYAPNAFTYILHKKIPIITNSEYKVRDILYTKGTMNKNDTLHIFVNHWKSRSGGQVETEPERIQCAQTLRDVVDSIFAIQGNAKILIMGDLNDEPRNISIFETLKANNDLSDNLNLFNLMLSLSDEGKGTHAYRGKWSMLDNLIVSQSLLSENSGFVVKDNEGNIFDADFVSFTNNKGEKSPNRTYGGNNYFGGFSDHYPVYVTFIRK